MKKAIALIIAFLMVFSLAGCGASLDADTLAKLDSIEAKLDSIEASLAAEDPPAEEAPAEEAPADVQTLTVGALACETGFMAVYDLNNVYELKCMVELINEAGGVEIGGTTYILDVVVADGQSDTEGMRSAANLLVESDVDFVIETNDFLIVSAQDIFENAELLHISSYNSLDPDAMGEWAPCAFVGTNGAAGDFASGFAILDEYYPEAQSVVFCSNDNGITEQQYALCEIYCAQYGFELLEESIIYSSDAVDLTSIATQIAASGADVFIGTGTVDNIGAIVKELRNMGDDTICAAIAGMTGESVLNVIGESAATNMFTLGVSLNEEDNTDDFNALYKRVVENYGQEVANSFTGNFADCLIEVLDMMQKAGSTESADVIAAFEEGGEIKTLYGTGYIGGTETYGIANHAVANPAPVTIFEDGSFRFAGWLETKLP